MCWKTYWVKDSISETVQAWNVTLTLYLFNPFRRKWIVLSKNEAVIRVRIKEGLQIFDDVLPHMALEDIISKPTFSLFETIHKLYKDLLRLQSFCLNAPWLLLTATCILFWSNRLKTRSMSAAAVLPGQHEILFKVNTVTSVSMTGGLQWYCH